MSEGPVEQAAGRGMLKGMVVATVIVGGVTFGIMLNAGAGLVPALGVAAFASFWGGPGFGGFLGATIAAVRAEKATSSLPPAATAATQERQIDNDPTQRSAA